MKQAIKQILKELKTIDQECIDLNKWNFENRNGFIKTLEWRLESALKEGKQSKDEDYEIRKELSDMEDYAIAMDK